MKRGTLIAAALGLLALAGCAHRISIIDPARPQVFVADGRVVVNQEPVIVKRPGTITWTVPWGSNLRFADNGITVDAFVKQSPPRESKEPQRRPIVRETRQVSLFKCGPANKELTEFACTVPQEVPPGYYAYTIRLLADGARSCRMSAIHAMTANGIAKNAPYQRHSSRNRANESPANPNASAALTHHDERSRIANSEFSAIFQRMARV